MLNISLPMQIAENIFIKFFNIGLPCLHDGFPNYLKKNKCHFFI